MQKQTSIKSAIKKPVMEKEVKTRHRRNDDEENYLLSFWEKDQEKWPKSKCEQIGKKYNFKWKAVQKWNWNQRKKYGLDTDRRNAQLTKEPVSFKKKGSK